MHVHSIVFRQTLLVEKVLLPYHLIHHGIFFCSKWHMHRCMMIPFGLVLDHFFFLSFLSPPSRFSCCLCKNYISPSISFPFKFSPCLLNCQFFFIWKHYFKLEIIFNFIFNFFYLSNLIIFFIAIFFLWFIKLIFFCDFILLYFFSYQVWSLFFFYYFSALTNLLDWLLFLILFFNIKLVGN